MLRPKTSSDLLYMQKIEVWYSYGFSTWTHQLFFRSLDIQPGPSICHVLCRKVSLDALLEFVIFEDFERMLRVSFNHDSIVINLTSKAEYGLL